MFVGIPFNNTETPIFNNTETPIFNNTETPIFNNTETLICRASNFPRFSFAN